MKLTMVMDPASDAELRHLRQQFTQGLTRLAEQGKQDAKRMAVLGANAGIYFTPSGHYHRTRHYLNSIGATGTVQGTNVIIEVFDTAEYASHLEYGELGALTPTTAKQLAEAVGLRDVPLHLGRSGLNWIQPNPAITRAAVFAGLRMINAAGQLLAGSLPAAHATAAD